MENEEIQVVETPQLLLTFDKKMLAVNVQGTRNLDLALMMLEGARVQLQFQRNMVAASQLAKQQHDIAQASHIVNDMRNGGPIR